MESMKESMKGRVSFLRGAFRQAAFSQILLYLNSIKRRDRSALEDHIILSGEMPVFCDGDQREYFFVFEGLQTLKKDFKEIFSDFLKGTFGENWSSEFLWYEKDQTYKIFRKYFQEKVSK